MLQLYSQRLQNIWDFLGTVHIWPIWDKTGALCWLIILGDGQTQTVGESFQHHIPSSFSSAKECSYICYHSPNGFLIQMLRLLHISIKRHSKRFVDGRKYRGPPWIDPWSEGSKYFDTGTNWKEASPQKTYRPNDLEEEGETAQTKHEKLYWFVHFKSIVTLADLFWWPKLLPYSRNKCIFWIPLLFIQSIHRCQNINNWFLMAQ